MRMDILLDYPWMTFFQCRRDDRIYHAPSKDDILLDLSCFIVFTLVLGHLHSLGALLPRIPYGLDNVLECDHGILNLVNLGRLITWGPHCLHRIILGRTHLVGWASGWDGRRLIGLLNFKIRPVGI